VYAKNTCFSTRPLLFLFDNLPSLGIFFLLLTELPVCFDRSHQRPRALMAPPGGPRPRSESPPRTALRTIFRHRARFSLLARLGCFGA